MAEADVEDVVDEVVEEPVAPVEPQETEADQQRGGKKAAPSPVPPAHTEPVAADPAAGLEEMRRQLKEAEARSAQMETAARKLQGERDQALAIAQEAEKRGISTQELMLEDQIKSTTDQRKVLVEQHAAAMTDGEYLKASQIIEKMQDLAVSHGFLSEKRLWLKQQREAAELRGKQPQPLPETVESVSSDPFEARVRGKYPPDAIAFLRKHPDLLRSDGTLKRRGIELHEAALDEGFTQGSDGYYAHIEKILGGDATAAETGNGAANGANGAVAAPPRGTAAPVSRGNVRVPGGGGKVQPTPTMRRLAAEQGVSVDDWMEHYQRLLAQGKITPVR